MQMECPKRFVYIIYLDTEFLKCSKIIITTLNQRLVSMYDRNKDVELEVTSVLSKAALGSSSPPFSAQVPPSLSQNIREKGQVLVGAFQHRTSTVLYYLVDCTVLTDCPL